MRNLFVFLIAIGTTLLATEAAMAQLAERKVLTLEAARKMVAAAERHHLRAVTAGCDDGDRPILVERTHAHSAAVRDYAQLMEPAHRWVRESGDF